MWWRNTRQSNIFQIFLVSELHELQYTSTYYVFNIAVNSILSGLNKTGAYMEPQFQVTWPLGDLVTPTGTMQQRKDTGIVRNFFLKSMITVRKHWLLGQKKNLTKLYN